MPDMLGFGFGGRRDKHQYADRRGYTNNRDGVKRRLPGKLMANPGSHWHANKVSHRKAGEHKRDSTDALLFGHHFSGEYRANPEECPVRQRRDHSPDDSDTDGRREGGDQIPHQPRWQESAH